MITWTTVSEYIDIETGEIISKSEIEKDNYKVIKKIKSHENRNGKGTTKVTNICRHRKYKQLDLFERTT